MFLCLPLPPLWAHSEKAAISSQEECSHQKQNLAVPWSWTFQPKNFERINFCCLHHPETYCGILVQQLKQTNTDGDEGKGREGVKGNIQGSSLVWIPATDRHAYNKQAYREGGSVLLRSSLRDYRICLWRCPMCSQTQMWSSKEKVIPKMQIQELSAQK